MGFGMSMIGWVLGVSPAQIEALRAEPTLAGDMSMIAAHDRMEIRSRKMMARLPPHKQAEAEARFRERETAPYFKDAQAEWAKARERLATVGPLEPALDLEKSWHVLHYLLTENIGPTAPPADLLLTGEELGGDVGYGPVRLHDASATRAFADFLEGLDAPTLVGRVNIDELQQAGVYGIPMGPSPKAEFQRELQAEAESFLPQLRDYVAAMAEKQNGLLVWLS